MEPPKPIKLTTSIRKMPFVYTGSVKDGTAIVYGAKFWTQPIKKEQFKELIEHFSAIGPVRQSAISTWMKAHVTKTPLAGHVVSILVKEGYATIARSGAVTIHKAA